MSYSPDQPPQPTEDVGRGTLLALLAVPAGIIVWVLVWSIGFIVSIISFGVAYLAVFLYRLGSGGTISRPGAIRVTIITLATVVLSIIAGIVSDVAISIGRIAKISPFEALLMPQFGEVFGTYIGDPAVIGGLAPSILIAIAFGVLGCFGILRGAFRATAPEQPVAQQPWPTLPQQPQADPFTQQQPAPQVPPADENPPQRAL